MFAAHERDFVVTIESIYKHMPYINQIIEAVKIDNIIVQGGEIGLIDKEILLCFLKSINSKVIIDTNGEFVDRLLDIEFEQYIDRVFIHITSAHANKKWRDNPKYVFGCVGNSVFEIEQIVKNNKDIIFKYIDLELSLIDDGRDFDIYKNYDELISALHSYDNISHEVFKYLHNKKINNRKIILQQEICQQTNPRISINLAEEKINLCTTRNNHIGIDLSKENFVNLITEFNNFKLNNHNCNGCVRSCANKNIQSILIEKNNNRKCIKRKL